MKALVRIAVATIWLATVLCAGGLSAQRQTAAEKFQEAVRLFETAGDSTAALRLFEDVARSADRALAARAVLYTGIVTERQGTARAAEAYRRVLREFPDQVDVVTQAKARLSRLTLPTRPRRTEPSIRQLTWPEFWPTGAPSADGRRLPGTTLDMTTLVVLDVASGEARPITPADPSPHTIIWSALSPDSRRVAYAWFSGDNPCELRVTSTEGGRHATWLRTDCEDLRPVRWTPDGRAVLTVAFLAGGGAEILLLADGEPAKRLVTLPQGPLAVDLSRDGRAIVFDQPQEPGSEKRDVRVLDVETGAVESLVTGPANDAFPVWLPDGRGVVFASDRAGGLGLWLQPTDGRKPRGGPDRLLPTMGRMLPLGITADGTFFYKTLTGLVDVYTVDVDLGGARVGEPQRVVAGNLVGSNLFSSWSEDGRWLAFTSRRAEVGFQLRSHSLVLRDTHTGQWREFVVDLKSVSVSAWAADGKRVLVTGRGFHQPDGPELDGLFWIDAATGALEPFAVGGGAPNNPRCSSDGRTVFFERAGSQGGRVIVARDLVTGEDREVVANGGAVNYEVSRDGRSLAYIELMGRQKRLRVVSTAGGEPREVTRFTNQENAFPAGWTPSGDEVIVAIRQDAAIPGPTAPVDTPWPTELWAIRVSDATRRRLGEVRMVMPRSFRVSPDGRQISFEAGIFRWSNWAMEGFVPRPARVAR